MTDLIALLAYVVIALSVFGLYAAVRWPVKR